MRKSTKRTLLVLILTPPSPELDQAQPVPEPLLPEGGALPGRAGQGQLLARGLSLRGQAGGAGLPQAAAEGRGLFQDAVRTALLQVRSLPVASEACAADWTRFNPLSPSALSASVPGSHLTGQNKVSSCLGQFCAVGGPGRRSSAAAV